jgi:hypothetical protein
MEWVEFLDSVAVKHKLTADQRDTLIARLDRHNDNQTNIQIAIELDISEVLLKKRLGEIYKIFESTCPDLASSQSRGKLEALRACLLEQYERRKSQLPQSEIVGIPNNLNQCHSGTPNFVGREQDWEWLCAEIQRPSQQPVIVALAGMGGVGKTELAIQYARQHLNDYLGGVCWIFAGESEIGSEIIRFAANQLNLADQLDRLVLQGKELSERLEFCWRHWLEGNVLLVFDDVADYAKVQPYLPPDPRFRVLLTTRRVMMSPVCSRSLEVLTQKAALELLGSEALVGKSRLAAEQSIAETLCNWLGYLPLGLELVGRYLYQEPDLSLATMLFNLQSRSLKEESLVRDPEDENWSLTAQRGVAAAFDLSWAKLKDDPRRLGRLLSLFALAPIPWELVESAEQYRCDLFPENGVFNPENLSKARRELVGLHLLKRLDQGIYLLHALIRKFFQQKLEELANAGD